MKRPRIRKTLDVSSENETDLLIIPEFAVFPTIEDSAQDLLLYYKHFQIPVTFIDAFDYVKILKDRKYFEDTFQNYFDGVSRAFNRLPIVI